METIGGISMAKLPVRVHARISEDANEWLDKRSKEMALSKSALIALAIENYRMQVEVTEKFPRLLMELEKQGVDLKKLFNNEEQLNMFKHFGGSD